MWPFFFSKVFVWVILCKLQPLNDFASINFEDALQDIVTYAKEGEDTMRTFFMKFVMVLERQFTFTCLWASYLKVDKLVREGVRRTS